MTTSGGPRYRFGPRDRRGLVAGARASQVVLVCAGLLVAVGLLRSLHSSAGVLVGAGVVAAAGWSAFWPVRGRTVEQWVPVALAYVSRLLLGGSSAVPARRSPGPPSRPPGPLGGFALRELAGSAVAGSFGALHDRRSGTWTAVLSLGSTPFALLGEEERSRQVAAWAGVLAAVSSGSGALHRLQWIERTLPDLGEPLVRHLEAKGVGPDDPARAGARRSYAELLEREQVGRMRHELFLACTVRAGRGARTGADVLAEEIGRLDRRCRDAGIPVEGVLSRAGLSLLVRRSFDEVPGAGPISWPWPMAVAISWSSVRTDGTWHATYWIAEWPRSDVASDFLVPLLVGCAERRSVAVVMAAVPPHRAIRAAEHARTSVTADAELRRRHGIATSARRHREHEAVARREGELADGHVAYRFSGYVTVTATSPAELESACSRVEQAAALARLELRRLYGAQGDALAFSLPTGRGCA